MPILAGLVGDLPFDWKAVTSGDRRALARAFTALESADLDVLSAIADRVFEHSVDVPTVGMTGPPGVGKSTLVGAVTTELRRRGATVGVLAVDPSSPRGGGALLGDRIRMANHAEDPGVYIRSFADRRVGGGLAPAVPLGAELLAVAGYDVVLIETVGVGQAELEVARTASTVVLVLAPNSGDGVQADKAGIMEVADIFVVNKADVGGAGQLERAIEHSMSSVPTEGASAWTPPVVRTVAVRGEGSAQLVDHVLEHRRALKGSGALVARRTEQARRWIEALVLEAALAEQRSKLEGELRESVREAAVEVATRKVSPYRAARRLHD